MTAPTRNSEMSSHFSIDRKYRSCPVFPSKATTTVAPGELRLIRDQTGEKTLDVPLDTFDNRYKEVKMLGEGSFGKVVKAKYTKAELPSPSWKKGSLLDDSQTKSRRSSLRPKIPAIMAVKCIRKTKNISYNFIKVEVNFIKAVPRHKNLLEVYDLFFDPYIESLYIATECMDMTLYELMKFTISKTKKNGFSEHTTKSILSQIVAGLRHIHDNGRIHFDIKPENILVNANAGMFSIWKDKNTKKHKDSRQIDLYTVKIADYGLCVHSNSAICYKSGAYLGTRWYRPPEGVVSRAPFSKAFDIWGLGCIATELVNFKPLFPGRDMESQIDLMLSLLGTPSQSLAHEAFGLDYVPIYGFWRLSYLVSKFTKGKDTLRSTDISHYLKGKASDDLCHLIRSCLYWDPKSRATIGKICEMKYFEGTCIDESPELSGMDMKLDRIALSFEDPCTPHAK